MNEMFCSLNSASVGVKERSHITQQGYSLQWQPIWKSRRHLRISSGEPMASNEGYGIRGNTHRSAFLHTPASNIATKVRNRFDSSSL